MSDTKQLQHFGPLEGRTYQMGRMKAVFKRTEGEGEGSYSVFESVNPPSAGAGMHRHPGFQETFFVLEGRYEFQVGEERRTLGPGEMIVVPRGAPHGFHFTSPDPGRLLTISTPAGIFEAFIAEVSGAMVDAGTPTGGPALDMRAIATRHGVEFL